ncbi:MAG: alpha/beta hydrolase family protein [Caldilineaceae bacterium]
MTQFFSTEAALRQRFQTIGRRLSLQADSQEAWQLWRQALRSRIRELQGVDRLVPTAPNPRITETVACDGYRRERVEIDTEPGVTMPVYVLIPDDLPGTAPGVLTPHGHSSGGKYAVAGIRGLDPGVDQTIDQHNYDYGVQAVRRGYVVFCPDARLWRTA